MVAALWIALAVVVVVALVATVHARRVRAEELAAADAPSRRELEAAKREALAPRELGLLTPSQRARYLDGWRGVEVTFAGDPEAGIALAEHITRELAMERGYPTESFHALAAELALDFPDEIEAYCVAHAVVVANERRAVSHRQLRRAMRAYRALFGRLSEPERLVALASDVRDER